MSLWPLKESEVSIIYRPSSEPIKYHVCLVIAMASRANVAQVRCLACGKTFLTQKEADEHTKLEHVEQKKPAGVS